VVPLQSDQNESSGAAKTGLGANNDTFSFSGLVNHNDQQTLSFSATDSLRGREHAAVRVRALHAAGA
jgi:hypothetical protein